MRQCSFLHSPCNFQIIQHTRKCGILHWHVCIKQPTSTPVVNRGRAVIYKETLGSTHCTGFLLQYLRHSFFRRGHLHLWFVPLISFLSSNEGFPSSVPSSPVSKAVFCQTCHRIYLRHHQLRNDSLETVTIAAKTRGTLDRDPVTESVLTFHLWGEKLAQTHSDTDSLIVHTILRPSQAILLTELGVTVHVSIVFQGTRIRCQYNENALSSWQPARARKDPRRFSAVHTIPIDHAVSGWRYNERSLDGGPPQNETTSDRQGLEEWYRLHVKAKKHVPTWEGDDLEKQNCRVPPG